MSEHNVTPSDDERATLINLWWRHGASFESHHTEGEEFADAVLAAGFHRTGQGEPEWEYGRTYYDEGANPHTRTVTEADHTSHPPDGYRSDGSPYWNYTQVRRRKAGLWLPADENGESE